MILKNKGVYNMKTNEKILKSMARLRLIETEDVISKGDNDITIDTSDGKKRLIFNDLTDDDLPLLIQIEQLKMLKKIL
jgi:hypothetical protein